MVFLSVIHMVETGSVGGGGLLGRAYRRWVLNIWNPISIIIPEYFPGFGKFQSKRQNDFPFRFQAAAFSSLNSINSLCRYSSLSCQLCLADKYLFTVGFQIIPFPLLPHLILCLPPMQFSQCPV